MFLIIGIITTFIAWCSAFIAGSQLYDRKKASLIDLLLFGFLILILHICTVILLCGLVIRNLHPGLLTGVSLLISAAIFIRNGKSDRELFLRLRSGAKRFIHQVSLHRFLVVCLVFFALFQVVSIGRIALAPPSVFDAQVYHLPISINWFQNNEIHVFDEVPVGRFNYATKLPKMLNFWLLAFTRGNIALIELTQYFGFILLMISVYSIAHSLRKSTFWNTATTVFTAFIPILIIEMHTLQDHMLLVALHFALIKLILDYIDGKFASKGRAIIAMCVSSGLLLAGKFSAPAHIAGIGAVFGLLFWKDVMKLISRKTIIHICTGLILIFLIGGIWYVFNYINYSSIFGPTHPQALKENILLTNILQTPYKLFEFDHRYTPDLINISGYGPFAVTVGLVLTLVAVYEAVIRLIRSILRNNSLSNESGVTGRKIVALMLSSVLLHLFYFSVYLTPYNYRLLSFTGITLVILSMHYVETSKSALLRRVTLILGVISMLFTLVTTIDTDYFSRPVKAWRDYLHSYSNDRTIVRFDYSSEKYNRDRSFVFIDQFISPEEPILYITQHEIGYDDVVVAGYYDNNLIRRAIWGGSIERKLMVKGAPGAVHSYSPFFNDDGSANDKLVSYMRQHNISYLHNNIVFYYKNPIALNPGPEFIEVTKNLYYLKAL